MSNYSYLVTFSNLFERKYFDEHLDEFFMNYIVMPESTTLQSSIVVHSNNFIEIGNKHIFKPFDLIRKFPKVKVIRKVVKNKSTHYKQIKEKDYV